MTQADRAPPDPPTGSPTPAPAAPRWIQAQCKPLAGASGRVQIDRVVEETYIATVKVEGPPGVQSVDARRSDALNLTALVQAPIFVGTEVLQEAEARCQGDAPTAARLRRALAAPPMTVEALGM